MKVGSRTVSRVGDTVPRSIRDVSAVDARSVPECLHNWDYAREEVHWLLLGLVAQGPVALRGRRPLCCPLSLGGTSHFCDQFPETSFTWQLCGKVGSSGMHSTRSFTRCRRTSTVSRMSRGWRHSWVVQLERIPGIGRIRWVVLQSSLGCSSPRSSLPCA